MTGGGKLLFKSKDKFALLLNSIALNLKESVVFFSEYEVNHISDLPAFSSQMKEFETKGDIYVHNVIKELNHISITPIEREDILACAMSMDDVLNGLEHCAALFDMYSITETDEYMVKFVNAIKHCSYEIQISIELLTTKQLLQIRKHTIKIKDYESQCDHIRRQCIRNLFSIEKHPIKIMQYKEIYESLEEIANCCQTVANTLETIIMKNT
jgi:predicted phosphate transport protein (TIGR00153 family)